MNKVNSICICKSDYKNEKDWEDAIHTFVLGLLNAEYVVVVRYDDKGLGHVVIEFNYADRSYGDDYPYWLNPDQVDILTLGKEDEE